MEKPIVNPDVPYTGPILGGLQTGKMIRIQGAVSRNADRFNINLQTGPNTKPRDDVGLHISVRIKQAYVARNSYQKGSWEEEEGKGKLPIGPGQQFEILILCDINDFKIAINGQHYCEFPYRLPKERLTHILIDGDVTITLISFEGHVSVVEGGGGDNVARSASTVESTGAPGAPPFEGPPGGGFGGPPPQGGYGGPPPQGGYGGPGGPPPHGGYGPPPGAGGGYGPPPPQGGYGPPGGPQGYGPPPRGYGPPPPPGSENESGFDRFVNSAQSALAEAIASGAAEKLLGDILHPNKQKQGYAPQNAQYGIYPNLPQDDLPYNQQKEKKGDSILSSLLSSLVSGPNSQQQQGGYNQQGYSQHQQGYNQQPRYQQGAQDDQGGQQGGGGTLGSILSSLVGPRDPQQGHQGYQQRPPPQQHQQQQQRDFHGPQIGGEGSVGGLGSMGSILGNLAGQILRPGPQQQQQGGYGHGQDQGQQDRYSQQHQ